MARQTRTSSRDDARMQSRRSSAANNRSTLRRNENEEEERSTRKATAKRTSAKAEKRDERRRERVKARAERMYNKQFQGDAKTASANVPAEGAPRAAIYEGKMGATQRRSVRMQRSSTANAVSAKINPAGWFAALPITERSLKVGTAIICTVLVCMFLYTPAQQYYQAVRERDQLAAEYSVIQERNTALDLQNDVLASDAGLEDAVRQKFGYVKEGEQTAIVTGLSDYTMDTSRDNEELEPAVLSSSVKAPQEWYTPLLDAFFGVG